MLKTRIVTTFALLSLITFIFISANPVVWTAFVFLFMVAAIWEWGRLAGLQCFALKIFTVFSAVFLFLCLSQSDFIASNLSVLCWLSTCFWVGLVPFVLQQKKSLIFLNIRFFTLQLRLSLLQQQVGLF